MRRGVSAGRRRHIISAAASDPMEIGGGGSGLNEGKDNGGGG